MFAQAIHDLSPRYHRPMVKVSCAAIPAALIESELFGRERGAYTGALSGRSAASRSRTSPRSSSTRSATCRRRFRSSCCASLQERVIERLGGNQSIKVDVRIIAATNRNLEKAVQDKSLPRRSLLPAQRLSDRPAAAPRAASRTFQARLGVHRRDLEVIRENR